VRSGPSASVAASPPLRWLKTPRTDLTTKQRVVAADVEVLNQPCFAISFASMLYGVLEVVTAFEVRSLPQRFDELTGRTGATHSQKYLDPVG
jgi:hypothetical protein